MQNLKKPINLVVGVIILVVCFNLFVGSGIMDSLFAPAVQDGKLGAPTATVLATLAELVISSVSALGGFGIYLLLNGGQMLMNMIEPAFKDKSDVSPVGTSSSNTSEGMMEDCARLLVQSAIDGDKVMTIALAEKLAGRKYLTSIESSSTFGSSFSEKAEM